jgi:hypothetical protein
MHAIVELAGSVFRKLDDRTLNVQKLLEVVEWVKLKLAHACNLLDT